MVFVPDRRIVFRNERSLRQQLTLDADTLRIHRVMEARQMGLALDLRLLSGQAMTVTGSQQFFRAVGDGTLKLVRTLLEDQEPQVMTQDTLPLLSKIVNAVIRHREQLLLETRLIICDARNELDGVVSSRYATVSNIRVLDLFTESASVMKDGVEFYQAAIRGRDLTVVLASKKVAASVGGTRFYAGLSCQNSETAGRAIRATNVLLDSESGTWSASPFSRETRVPHIRSRKLQDKMMQIGETLARTQPKSADLAALVTRARVSRVSSQWNKATKKIFSKSLHLRGERLGVKSAAIDAVLAKCDTAGQLRAPTVFEVYLACLLVAKQRELNNSLPLRQLAFSLIFPKGKA